MRYFAPQIFGQNSDGFGGKLGVILMEAITDRIIAIATSL